MKDRRGYEADDLRKAAKAVERKGGKKSYERAMREERKDYRKDVKANTKKPSGKMCGW